MALHLALALVGVEVERVVVVGDLEPAVEVGAAKGRGPALCLKKNAVPVVALVGYTNAGKSTMLRRLTEADGALLIFDEVMTGFRVGPAGAQGLFGVRPDLTTLGKVVGGGLPVGAFGGRGDVMDLVAPAGRAGGRRPEEYASAWVRVDIGRPRTTAAGTACRGA